MSGFFLHLNVRIIKEGIRHSVILFVVVMVSVVVLFIFINVRKDGFVVVFLSWNKHIQS